LAARTTQAYDALGRLQATEDALGNRTSSVYDALDRMTAQEDARGHRTSFAYDALGQRLALVDANGGRWSSTYDARGSEAATTDPLGALHTYQYDPVGSRALRVDARGWPTTYQYDALDRETGRLYRDDTRVTHQYDSAGRVTGMADVTGNTGYEYDAVGRQTAVAYPWGHRLTYGFDPVGNRQWMDAPDGRTTYGYDPQNRVTAIENPYQERTTIQWDPLDREQHRTLANGMAVSHLYDPAGRETLLANRRPTGEGLAIYTAQYDRVGNRLTCEELDGSRVTYGYDRSYQLTSEVRSGTWPYDLAYEYDGVGSRLRKLDAGLVTSYQYNAAQELWLITPPTGAPTTQTWDANGNLAGENTGGLLTTYAWDSENRLVVVATPEETEEYAYAADGKRRTKSTDFGPLLFVWDGENLLLESTESLMLQARYTDFPGWWGGLVSSGPLPSTVFYGFDLTASCRVETTPAGVLLAQPTYDAFGVEYPEPDAPEDPIRYVGLFGYRQDTVGRYYVRARHLASGVGRWLSRDPTECIGMRDAYGSGSTVGSPDPTGLAPRWIGPNPTGCSEPWHSCVRDAVTSVCSLLKQQREPGSPLYRCLSRGRGTGRDYGAEQILTIATVWCSGGSIHGSPKAQISCNNFRDSAYAVSECYRSNMRSLAFNIALNLTTIQPADCGTCREKMVAVIAHELILHVAGCIDHSRRDCDDVGPPHPELDRDLTIGLCLDRVPGLQRGKCSTVCGLGRKR